MNQIKSTMYSTEDLIQLSALQRMVFCPRRCALIHIEQTWAESGRTAEGRIMHDRVHDEGRDCLPLISVW